jgi:hypothetical protein
MQEGRKTGDVTNRLRRLSCSCFPAFLISSWVAANRQCAAEGIQVRHPGAQVEDRKMGAEEKQTRRLWTRK